MSRRHLFQIVALPLLVLAAPAWAATYYVKPAADGGSDAAAGTSIASAWATLQKAADTAVAGDTVKVAAGTYANGFNAVHSGTVDKRITFEPLRGTGHWSDSGITVNGFATEGGQRGPIWILGKTCITVKGFTCTTGTGKGNFQAGTGATGTWFVNCRSTGGGNFWGCKVTDSDDCVVEGGLFEKSAGEHGIYVSGSNRYTLRGNTCRNNAWDGIHTNITDFAGQTVFNNSGGLIERNVCTGNGLAGMDLTGMTDGTLRNNLVYGNGTHGVSTTNASGAGTAIPGCSGNLIVNNTLLSGGRPGRAAIRFAATAGGTGSNDAGTTCFNNILLGTAGAGALEHFGGVSRTFRSDYNIVVNAFRITPGRDITLASWRSNTGNDAHSAVATPSALFTNAAGDDYTLKSGSPAIGFGRTSFNGRSAPTDDKAGTPRGAVPDAGAYQFAAGAPTR